MIVIVVLMVVVAVFVAALMSGLMIVPVVAMAAGEQKGAGDVDGEPQGRDRDRFLKPDWPRREEPADGFDADQKRDHGQNDGAGEAGQVSELAGPEGEPLVLGVTPGQGIGHGRQEQGAGMS